MDDKEMMKRVMDGIPDMPIKVQDEREANYKSFAQSARVNGIPEAYTPAKGGLLPEPQPVAGWLGYFQGNLVSFLQTQEQVNQFLKNTEPVGHVCPVYTNPPKKEWVGLTDEEILAIYDACDDWEWHVYERMLEAKLKEKNA